MTTRRTTIKILLTTDDEEEANAEVQKHFPGKKVGKERVLVWNRYVRPDDQVRTAHTWVVFEVTP
jgi:hypothetical protein